MVTLRQLPLIAGGTDRLRSDDTTWSTVFGLDHPAKTPRDHAAAAVQSQVRHDALSQL
jgi:hypothetical protein